jgi:formylglycine-generating enzyme required for sulfatase activity
MTATELQNADTATPDEPGGGTVDGANAQPRSRYIPKEVATRLLEEACHRCCLCRVLIDPKRFNDESLFDSLEKHHIHHFSEGGGHTEDNLVLVCANCHTQIHQHPENYPVDVLREKKRHWIGMKDVVPAELRMADAADGAVLLIFSVESLNLQYLISAPPQATVSELALFVGEKILKPLGEYDGHDDWLYPEKVGLALRSAPEARLDPGLGLGELQLAPGDALVAHVPTTVIPVVIPPGTGVGKDEEPRAREESQERKAEVEPRRRLHILEPEMVRIPAGEFWIGTDRLALELAEVKWGSWMERETPYHQVYLPAYEIGMYPVTNAQYAAFVRATGHGAPRHWKGGQIPPGEENHPVVYVSWRDARAFCEWLSRETGQPFRLPTEAEWEKAARGMDGRIWPWGNRWDPTRCNSWEGGPHETTPVGHYSPRGDSLYEAADMVGNVWEWCSSLYKSYPYDPGDGREDLEAGGSRVLRGGSWFSYWRWSRCAGRTGLTPDVRGVNWGFRVCVSTSSPLP